MTPNFYLTDINARLEAVNLEFTSRSISRRAYTAKFNRTKNLNSLSNRIKRFGAKVTREFAGYYVYVGINFTAKFNEDACESVWWEVNIADDTDPKVEAIWGGMADNCYEQKSHLLAELFKHDMDLSSCTDEA
tara:strand:+ start:1197 stop:1595 length:399 start_codon:yes stop_codon:yes gene_type:complete